MGDFFDYQDIRSTKEKLLTFIIEENAQREVSENKYLLFHFLYAWAF